MKKAIFSLLLLVAGSLPAFAQIYVNGVKLSPNNTGQYIELDPQFKTDGSCSFIVDFGQANSRKAYVSDEKGQRIDYISLIDGLNIFYEEGWEVAQISVLESGRRYLLKRRY